MLTNCEKLSKFVEVTAKMLSVPFFLGHGVLTMLYTMYISHVTCDCAE